MVEPSYRSPEERARDLLLATLGPHQFRMLDERGYLEIWSRKRRGRIYRLEATGAISFREPWQTAFWTGLCIQPVESVPLADQIAMWYLLITADEDRLLKQANHYSVYGSVLCGAFYQVLGEKMPAIIAGLMTVIVFCLSIGSLAGEAWLIWRAFGGVIWQGVVLFFLLLIPAMCGAVLVVTFLIQGCDWIGRWRYYRMARQSMALE